MSSEEESAPGAPASVAPEAPEDQTVTTQESHGESDKSAEFVEVFRVSESVEGQTVQEDVSSTESVESSPAVEGQTVPEEDKNETEATEGVGEPENSAEVPAEEPAEETTEEAAEDSAEESAEDEGRRKLTIDDIKTAPMDFRFPTTNQAKHCFTRYVEYHRCVQVKGEGSTDCDKYARYYRSLCPSEWVERWNEQRENGTFAGPL